MTSYRSMKQTSLTSLLADVRAGKTGAYDKLLGILWPLMTAASYGLKLNPDWAQEARTLVYNFALSWQDRPEKHFKAELYALLRRESQNFYYHHFRKLNKVATGVDRAFLENKGVAGGPEGEELDRLWLKDRLKTIVKGLLDPTDAKIVYLYFYKGLKEREISAIIGIGQSTVSRRLSRALKELKQTLEIQELYAITKNGF